MFGLKAVLDYKFVIFKPECSDFLVEYQTLWFIGRNALKIYQRLEFSRISNEVTFEKKYWYYYSIVTWKLQVSALLCVIAKVLIVLYYSPTVTMIKRLFTIL